MIKKIIAPIQTLVLMQGKCVGCGKDLKMARIEARGDNSQKIICKCKRIYILDKRNGKYRRAKIEEVN